MSPLPTSAASSTRIRVGFGISPGVEQLEGEHAGKHRCEEDHSAEFPRAHRNHDRSRAKSRCPPADSKNRASHDQLPIDFFLRGEMLYFVEKRLSSPPA